MRRTATLAVVVAILAGCGEDEPSPFAASAERACRAFDDDGFAGHIPMRRAERLYARLGEAIRATRPAGDGERRAQTILLRYVDGARELFADAPRDAPDTDLRLVVGPTTVAELTAVREAGLPTCADVLKGKSRHEEAQVIR